MLDEDYKNLPDEFEYSHHLFAGYCWGNYREKFHVNLLWEVKGKVTSITSLALKMMSFIFILYIFSLTLPSLGRLKLDMLSALSPPLLSFAQ